MEHIRTMDDGRPVLVPKLALGRDPQGVLIVRKMAASRTACALGAGGVPAEV